MSARPAARQHAFLRSVLVFGRMLLTVSQPRVECGRKQLSCVGVMQTRMQKAQI